MFSEQDSFEQNMVGAFLADFGPSKIMRQSVSQIMQMYYRFVNVRELIYIAHILRGARLLSAQAWCVLNGITQFHCLLVCLLNSVQPGGYIRRSVTN